MVTMHLATPPFGGISREIEKLAEQINRGYYRFCPTDTWTPAVNLYELPRAYLVCVDLAGVEKEAIDLTVVQGRLRLQGRRSVPEMPPEMLERAHGAPAEAPADAAAETPAAEPADASPAAEADPELTLHEGFSDDPAVLTRPRARVHLMEIDHGSFCREVELPADVNRDRIIAAYRNGMLWVELPKVN
ncbi:MAG: Hsp20/alpha crystallin family protein [Phycisphaerae bacterium]